MWWFCLQVRSADKGRWLPRAGPELSNVLREKAGGGVGDGTPARNNQREYTVRNEKMVLMGYCVKSECTIEGLREALYKHWPNPSTGTKALSERRVRAGFSYYVRVS